jgi:hypothetical protein
MMDKGECCCSFDKKSERMGFGVIIRDDEGKVIAAKCVSRNGLWDSYTTEALATYYDAIFHQERGVTQLILEGMQSRSQMPYKLMGGMPTGSVNW